MQHWTGMGKEDCKDHPYFSIFLSKLTKYRNILQYIKKVHFGSCQTSMLGFSAKIDNAARKVSKYGVISGQYFPVRIQKNTDQK